MAITVVGSGSKVVTDDAVDNSNTIGWTLPGSLADGDFCIALASSNSSSSVGLTATGWTAEDTVQTSTALTTRLLSKVLAASDSGGSVSWTWDSSRRWTLSWIILRDTAGVLDNHTQSNLNSTSTQRWFSLTPVADDCMLVGLGVWRILSGAGTGTVTPNGAWTEFADQVSSQSTSPEYGAVGQYQQLSGGGGAATGNQDGSFVTQSANLSSMWTISVAPGTSSATVVGPAATATALAPAGTVSAQKNPTISGPAATATASAPAGTVSAGATVSGPTATSTWDAPAGTVVIGGSPDATVVGEVATATAEALAGTVATERNVTIAGPVATATARAWAGTVSATSDVTIAGPVATASLVARAGTVLTPEPTFWFKTSSVPRGIPGARQPLSRYTINRGVSVVKVNGHYVEMPYPVYTDLLPLEANVDYFLGGRVAVEVSLAVATALEEDGFETLASNPDA